MTLTDLLCKIFPYKEMGWKEIGETFYRWTLLKTPWFRVYLHKLDAPRWHPQCHDHPWDFIAILLSGGYWEQITGKNKNRGQHVGGKVYWRKPGTILYRPANFAHNVVTQIGVPNWSIVFVTNKKREWGMVDCR
jgi:hypothetical protein